VRKVLPLLTLLASSALAQTTITLHDSLWFAGDTVTWVKRLPHYCEGPAWNPATGEVTFSQIGSPGTSANRPHWLVWRIKPGQDTGSVFYDKGQSNGQVMAPNGRLSIIQRDVVIQFDSAGNVDTLVYSGKDGVVFNANNNSDNGSGNDLSFASNGAFYFTTLSSGIYYVDTTGKLSQAYSQASSANGILWREEENAVYVHEGNNVRRYERAANGALSNRTTFVNVQGMGADGGCIDAHGNRFIADYSQGMVRAFNAAGQGLGVIQMRGVSGNYDSRPGNAGNASNCTFGGPDLKTLYFTGDGGLYSLRMKIPGRTYPGQTTALRPGINRMPAKTPAAGGSEWRDARGRLVEGAATKRALKAPVRSVRRTP
jgi:gluconolactonase